MTLIKTTLWTGISTFIKVVSTYVMWKVIAVYTGPAGVAFIEQFQNFIQIARSLSCSLNLAIIKYVAEYKNDDVKKSKILSSAFIVYLVASLFVSIILFCFHSAISLQVLQSVTYKNAVILLGASIILYSLNSLLASVLNGELEIKKYASCNIANTIIIFFLTTYLVIHYGVYGGLVGIILNQSIVLFFTLFLVVKCHWFTFQSYFKGIDVDSLNKLVAYGIMSLVTILIGPISLIIIRNYIAYTLSWKDAGYWDGIMKLSGGYLILMNLMFSIYYLPKFSGIHVISELKSELIRSYRIIFPLAIFAATSIFILKNQIVRILYSEQFIPMVILFKYQLIGDVGRISSWVLINFMLAKAMVKLSIFTEVFFSLSYILLTILFVHYFGLIGTSIGFAINYVLYGLFVLLITLRYLNKASLQSLSEV